MKRIALFVCLAFAASVVNAQLIKPKKQETYTLDEKGQVVKKKALFESKKGPVPAKYLAGACPLVDGKVTWQQTIEAPGLSSKEIYDRLLKYFMDFCESANQTEKSNVSVVEETKHQIGVRIQEWLVFENKPLSLDRTKFNYQIIADCSDGSATVTLRNISYIYEEERGGGTIKGEEMLADENALNKNGDGFNLGGYRKFRMKTIDRKDEIMKQIAEILK
jgi:colicin import membrane protein